MTRKLTFLILALFALISGPGWGQKASGTYTLVTDASTLSSGDVIVLGCAGKGTAAGAMGTGAFLTSVDATISNGTLTSANAIEITLGGSAGAWTLTTSEGQITTSAAKALKLNNGTQKTWTISITSAGVATITGGSYGSIQYNASSPRFVNYTSAQTAIEIYKKQSTPSATLESIEVSGTPNKTTYNAGEEFAPAGLVVTGTYDDTSTAEITSGITWTVTPNPLTAGTTSVSVTATVDGKSDTKNYDVTVNAIEGDRLTLASTGISGSSYAEWSGKTGSEGVAVYAGKSAGSNNAIQLNNTNPNGIVSTTSAGLIKKVKVDWESHTSDGRYITIYGSNTAYTSSANVYDTEKQGTSLGTIKKGTNTELTITGDYAYVGVKANSALYMNSITFIWSAPKVLEGIAVKTAPTTVNYAAGEFFNPAGLEITATYDDASTEDIAYAGNESNFTFSPGLTTALTTTNTSVTITYAGKETTQEISVRALNTYNITWMANGIAVTLEPATVVEGSAIGDLPTPEAKYIPEGFSFAGWSTSMASTTAITGTYNVTEDTDLFAIFAKVEGGSGEATAALTNSDITGSSLTNTYGDFSITNTYGTWSGNGCKQGNFSGDGMHFLQLRNNSTVSYLKLPVFPGNITSIVCEQVCNTSKEQYTGNIYFRTEANNDAEYIVSATSNEALDDVTLDIPSGYTTGYIMVSAPCRIYSFTVTYQSGVTKYYTRVFQDEYVMDDITIEGPSIIPAGSTLNMDTYTLTSEDATSLIIEDGGQLIQNSEGVMATVLKNITGYGVENEQTTDGYYLVANPTATNANEEDEYDALDGCTAAFDLYTFDPTKALEWVNIGSTSQKVTFERSKGYLYANAQDMTLHFRGYLLPTNEATSINLVYYTGGKAGREFPGFNLIGNPYTCDAYVNGYNFYTMADGEFILNEGSATIAPCEGFFVEATTTDQRVTLSTGAPEASASTLSLTVNQNRGNVIDRAIVRFDGANDMHKFMLNPAHTNISLAKNGEEFAAVSTNSKSGEMPVNFKAAKNGTYTITVNTENVDAEYLHLIDNKTGMDIDLLASTGSASYTFDAKTSDYASRFKLVFGVNNADSTGSASNFAYMSDGNLVIDNIEGQATLQIIDELGRVISTETVNGSYNKTLNLKAGLYILNLNGMTQKIVVK